MAFASHLAMFFGFFVGIIPSVLLVFMTLKDYDEYYKDKHFFYLMIVGLFAGIITPLLYYTSILYMAESLSITIFVLIIIGFAIYEGLLFTIVLSMKRFEDKYELAYYGIVLGGTIAGVTGMFNVYVYLYNLDPTIQGVLSILLMMPTLPLLYMALGAIVGYGIYKNNSAKFIGLVIVLKIFFNILYILWFIAFLYWEESGGWEWMCIGLVFAFVTYRYAIVTILPSALPEHLSKHKRRVKRRQRRKTN